MVNAARPPNDEKSPEEEPLSPEERARLDRPLHEILGIELNFVSEALAPPVDLKRLRAFIRQELEPEDRD